MIASELNTIYFVNKFGSEKKQIPFPVSINIRLMDIIPEISKKFGINSQNICIANMGGQVLTSTDLISPIKDLVEKFGNSFDIIDRGIVGSNASNIIDDIIQEFTHVFSFSTKFNIRVNRRSRYEIPKIGKNGK